MAITVTSLGSKGPFNHKGEITDVIEYQVSGNIANRWTAMSILGIYDQPHPYVPNLRCTDIIPTDDTTSSGNRVCKFDATYARSKGGGSQANLKVRFGFIQEPADVDAAGNSITNSAGDPFNPPTYIDKLVIFFDILKRQNGFSVANAKKYVGKVNKDPVTLATLGLCGHHTLRCLNYAPAESYYIGDTDVLVLYQFAYREDNWDRKLLDAGFQAYYEGLKRYSTSSDIMVPDGLVKKGKLVYLKSPTQGITSPALLDGHGAPLDVGTPSLRAGLSVEDKKGFGQWAKNPTDPITLSGYYKGTKGMGTTTAGAVILPYDMCGEEDFSHFVSVGV